MRLSLSRIALAVGSIGVGLAACTGVPIRSGEAAGDCGEVQLRAEQFVEALRIAKSEVTRLELEERAGDIGVARCLLQLGMAERRVGGLVERAAGGVRLAAALKKSGLEVDLGSGERTCIPSSVRAAGS